MRPPLKPDPVAAPLPIACGIIASGRRLLVARRREGTHLAGTWEFPGGRARHGESLEDALRREIEEEIGITFGQALLIHVKEHAYPERTVLLHFYLCLDPRGEPEGREGQEIRWASADEILSLGAPAANREVLELLGEQLS
jgi:mutator protein MutT